jgi:group I intron endonuclease
MVTNKLNGKIYVGSSNNIAVRWYHHKYYSASGSMKLPKFYNALRKYGSANFEWKILTECTPEELYSLEQKWLDENFDDFNYNVSRSANAPMRGTTFSPEHIDKLTKARQGRIFSIQTRKKMAKSQSGSCLLYTSDAADD